MFQKTLGLLVVLLSCGWSNLVATKFGPEVDTSALANGFWRQDKSVESLVADFIAFLREKDLASATTMLSDLQALNMMHNKELHQKMTNFFMLLKTYATVKSRLSGNVASYPNEFERLLVENDVLANNIGLDGEDADKKLQIFDQQIDAAIEFLKTKQDTDWSAFSKAPSNSQHGLASCVIPPPPTTPRQNRSSQRRIVTAKPKSVAKNGNKTSSARGSGQRR